MKIFNISETCSDAAVNPVWFYMPDSTIVRSGNPFFIPDFDDKFEAYPALALKINRLGKSIAPRFIDRYFCEATLAITVRATHLLDKLRDAGLPWTPAVNFDKSCFLGNFIEFLTLMADGCITLHTGKDSYQISVEGIHEIIRQNISQISCNNIIKTGDIFLMPLAAESFILEQGMVLTATSANSKLLEMRIK